MEHIEHDGERVRASKRKVAVEVWYGRTAALLQLDGRGRSWCSFTATGRKPQLTKKSVEVRTCHNEFAARSRQSLGDLLIGTGDVTAQLYVTLELHSYIDYRYEQNRPLRWALVIREVEMPLSALFVGHRYV